MYLELAREECRNSTAPFGLSLTSATISSLLLLVTIPTNLLVCLAILIDPNRELKTQFNCFTFNLALADLLVGCVTETVGVYAHVTEAVIREEHRKVSKVVLLLFHIPYFISAMASVLSIAALALERYLAIISPFRYRQYFSVKLCFIISLILWLIAITFGLVNFKTDYIFQSFLFVNTGVVLTTLIVCFASCKIRSSLQRMKNDLAKLGVQNPSIQKNQSEVKLTKTFSLMIGALMCCYIPACCVIYYMNLCQDCDCELVQWFRDASFWLILLNSAINPFIYAIRSSSFRRAIKQILCCICCKKKRRSIVLSYAKRRKHIRLNTATNQHTSYGSVSNESSGERVQLIYQ